MVSSPWNASIRTAASIPPSVTSGLATDGLADPNPFDPVYQALQSDGRIVVAGNATVGQVPEFGVARFLGDNPISDANQRLVTHVYLDLLGRSPDASGLM